MTRLLYFLTGVLALYRAVALIVGIPPNPHPWIATTFLISAFSLLLAGLAVPHKVDIWAVVGSFLILAVYVYGLFLLPLARKLGYFHVRARLVSHAATWFDRWRQLLDRPVWVLLLIFAAASLWFSVRAVRTSSPI